LVAFAHLLQNIIKEPTFVIVALLHHQEYLKLTANLAPFLQVFTLDLMNASIALRSRTQKVHHRKKAVYVILVTIGI
jgi:hypothetical protein